MGYWKKVQAELDEMGDSTDGIDIEKEMKSVEKDWFDEHVEVLADDEDLAKNVKNIIKNELSGSRMRTYIYTLADETEYEISIDAESEGEAEEILDGMSEKQIKKNAKESSDLQIVGVKKEKKVVETKEDKDGE